MIRDDLGDEAQAVALTALRDHHDVPSALYEVYMHFRERFIAEHGLLDSPPGGPVWVEALSEARALELSVGASWASAILRSFSGD